MRFILTRRTLLTAILTATAPLAGAETDYPNKPIRMLVGYAAGGGVDALARMLSARLPELLGQQVVVENRPGATGMIAAEAVARSAPDGYSLLMGETGLLIAPYLQIKSPVDPLKAFMPVAGAFIAPLLIVVNNNVPADNPRELIALLKKEPGRYSYATSGVGTVHHLGFEMLLENIGTSIVHVPYRGAAQIVPDVISGQIPIGVVSAAGGLAHAKSGKLKAIAFMSTGKLAGAENIPAMADAVPGFNVAPRIMLLAPSGTSAFAMKKLNASVRTLISSPDLVQAAAIQGAIPAYMEPGLLGPEMQRESAEWAKIVKARNITAQ